MRPILHGDVVAAARVLYGHPAPLRAQTMQQLLDKVRIGEAYRMRRGRAHPTCGDGSLMTAALARRPGPEPSLSDTDYCACLAQVLDALVVYRSGPGLSPTRR